MRRPACSPDSAPPGSRWLRHSYAFFHEQAAKEGNVARIRAGEIAATAIVLGTGWAVSGDALGRFPIYAAIAISAVFIGGYEYQIQNPSKAPDDQSGGQATPNAMLDWGNPG